MALKIKKRIIIPFLASIFLFVGVSFKEDFFEIAKQIEIFTTLFKTINTSYMDETNPAQLMDRGIKSMLAELDPYTVYFNEQDVAKFKINNTGEYTGIGAMISRKNGKLIITEPYKNYPADKAGLKAGDEITQIGDVILSDFKEDASQLLKGGKNSKLKLKYKRNNQIKDTELVLEEVDIKAVPFFTKIDEKTGYIVLEKFNAKASIETKDALEKLKEQGATQIILDLRGNPGGLLSEAVNVCNLFVPNNELIVTTKSHITKYNNTYKTKQNPIDTEIPLVILIDGKSASASEIVAGALQDLDRAVIVGNRSFGKGLVQRPIDLTYGTQLKITISRYYTPSGRCIQALDYAKKDANGKPIHINAKNYNMFKTKNGRNVYDAGGVMPDVVVGELKPNVVLDAISKTDAIFNFVTQYYYKNSNHSKAPILTMTDFLNFKTYLKTEKISLNTKTEKSLKLTYELAKEENLEASVQQAYDNLLVTLQKAEETELDKAKTEILNLLQDEVLLRYEYKEGLYQYYSKNNVCIKTANKLINNKLECNKIFKDTQNSNK